MIRYFRKDTDPDLVWRDENGVVTVASKTDPIFTPWRWPITRAERYIRITSYKAAEILGIPVRGLHATERAPVTVSKATLYVATVLCDSALNADLPLIDSAGRDEQWASFIGTDKDAVIAKATEAAHKWNAGRDKYRVAVGTLAQIVKPSVKYTLENL